MTHRIGDVEMQGKEPSNVIYAAFTAKVVDGGKARIKARRSEIFGSIRIEGAVYIGTEDTSPCEMPVG